MNKIKIHIKLEKKQVINDVAVQCTAIARELTRHKETEAQGADLLQPENDINKPVIARAMTEGFGKIKQIVGAYLIYGKDEDDNRLEATKDLWRHKETIEADGKGNYDLIAGMRYLLKIKTKSETKVTSTSGKVLGDFTGEGEVEYTPAMNCRILVTEETTVTYCTPVYGVMDLILSMPCNYNMGLTETVKSCSHRMMVDYIMQSLLLNIYPEKAAVYIERYAAEEEGLRKALRGRTSYGRRATDWA